MTECSKLKSLEPMNQYSFCSATHIPTDKAAFTEAKAYHDLEHNAVITT
jgi:hypothetical protein